MTLRFSWSRILLVALAALAGSLLWRGQRTSSQPAKSVPAAHRPTASSSVPAAPSNEILSGRPADQPEIEITPDHQLARVRHKDASGLVPLEYVETPQGRVTIRRTFSTSDGALLKEEAFLNDKPVPVPSK